MTNYDNLIELIKNNSDIVQFGEFGSGVSDFWIQKAQERLNVNFPPSYNWWLKNYSGGEVIGEEIYSVYELNFDTVVGGDIVYINELERKGLSNFNKLIIQKTDLGETFYFDLLQKDQEGECKVYREFCDEASEYADNFLQFLERRIIEI
jgi:hypothetical protein